MTKKQLLEHLAPFDEDALVEILLFSSIHPLGAFIRIQDVRRTGTAPPDGDILALVSHLGAATSPLACPTGRP